MKRRLKLFLAASLFVVPGQMLHAQITLNQRNTTVKAVIQRIQKQTKYKFFYDDVIGRTSVQNIKVDNANLNATLTRLFSGKDITWTLVDNIVYLRRNNTAQPKPVQKDKKNDQGKTTVVAGTVVDANGDPVIGASVSVNGSTGAITDINGHYVVNAAPGDDVSVSYVGFEPQRAKVGRHSNLDFTMREDQQAINEVVVVGFGTQKKIDLTGAVSTVSGKELAERPVKNVAQALQGMIPGLQISSNSGEMGSSMNINVRGTGTIGQGSSGSPLVLIDGVEGTIDDVNPQDIDNISVLKDAAASSIYGSRAPFGVILITTKNGDHGGKTRINYNNSFRFSNFIREKHMMNSIDWASFLNDTQTNSGSGLWYNEETMKNVLAWYYGKPWSNGVRMAPDGSPVYAIHIGGDKRYWGNVYNWGCDNVDWNKVVYKNTAFAQQHNASISGGTKVFNYYTSFSFLDNGGFMDLATDKYKRLTATAKITSQVTKWLSLSYNMRYSHIFVEQPRCLNSSFYGNFLRRGWPTLPVYDPYGRRWPGEEEALTLEQGGQKKDENDVTSHQIVLTFEPIKNWKTHVDFDYQYNYYNHQVYANYTYNQTDVEGTSRRIASTTSYDQESLNKNKYYNFKAWSEYDWTLTEKHNFHVMGGFQAESNKLVYFSAQKNGLLDDSKPELDLTSGLSYTGEAIIPAVYGNRRQWQTAGFYGRLNYNFKQMYLLEANLRYDGTSRFRRNRRWRAFPSVSVGWRLSEEPFMKGTRKWLDNMKVRLSYGSLGNQNTSNFYPTYQIISFISSGGTYLVNGNRPNIATAPNLVSASLGWEKVISYNVGLDINMLRNRLSASFDYYIRDTKDMVGNAPELPALLGTTVPVTNNTDLSTRGWELEIGWHDTLKNGLWYSVKGNISDARSKVTRYPNNPTNSIDNYIAGQYLNNIWGYTTKGLAKTNEEMEQHLTSVKQTSLGSNWAAGDIMYEDLDGDGRISAGGRTLKDHGDLSIIGNTTPRYLFGLEINVAWKGFDFRTFFQGVAKRDAWTDWTEFYFGANGKGVWWVAGIREAHDYFRNEDTWSVENKYQKSNTDAWLPRPQYSDKNIQVQTRYLMNAAYLRMKNLQLGYTIPRTITQRWKIENLRVFFSADNVFTVTSLPKQFDPEIIGNGANRANGYPLSRTFSFGLNITL